MNEDSPGLLLLDTCAIIWIADGSPIAEDATHAIQSASNADRLCMSPISAWEIGMVMARGRLRSPLSPSAFFARFIEHTKADYCEMTPEILITSSYLPGEVHGDPADRILIATARQLDMTIVTRDQKILAYARRGYVHAVEC